MSIRVRNGKIYYRYTIWDKDAKKYHYLERLQPLRRPPKLQTITLSNETTEAVFWRFKEPSTASLPLHFLYYYDCEITDVYSMRISDIDFANSTWKGITLSKETIRLLRRQIDRISTARLLFNFEDVNDYLVVNLHTGKKISPYQIGYVEKVVRKEIDKAFSIKRFMSHKNL